MQQTIPFTKEGYEKIKNEYDELMKKRPDAVMHLRLAREMGDLSENGYYHASKGKLTSLDSRLRHLKKLLLLGRIVENKGNKIADIGSNVIIETAEKKKFEYSLVGGYESDPKNGKISLFSPIGKALKGKRTGDTVYVITPAGEMKYRIIEIK
jgi:transcription elongation factor GreA